jgi:hypothetical protein
MMSEPQVRDSQGNSAMRDATLSRRDMLWAAGAVTVRLFSRSRLWPLPPNPAQDPR